MANCLKLSDWNSWSIEEKVQRSLPVIRFLESASFEGKYNAYNKDSGASGAYQFIGTTWREMARLAGVKGYHEARDAPKAVQDKVAAYNFDLILRKNKEAIYAIPLTWFRGSIGDYPAVLSQPSAAASTQAKWAQTWGGYVDRFTDVILCGQPRTDDVNYAPSYDWGTLPICLGETGERAIELNKLMGLKTESQRFGTALQYLLVKFQIENKLPVTGCFGEKEKALLVDTFISSPVSGITIADTELVKAVMSSRNISFVDSSKRNDFLNGGSFNGTRVPIANKAYRTLLGMAENHRISVSSAITSHPTGVNGAEGGVSRHKKGWCFDVNVIDGVHVGLNNVTENMIAELCGYPANMRPERLGVPDRSKYADERINGVIVFADGYHNNVLHIQSGGPN